MYSLRIGKASPYSICMNHNGWRNRRTEIVLFLTMFIFFSEKLLHVWCGDGAVKSLGPCVHLEKTTVFSSFFLRPSRRTHKDCNCLQQLQAGSMPAVQSKKKRMFFLPCEYHLKIHQRSTFLLSSSG